MTTLSNVQDISNEEVVLRRIFEDTIVQNRVLPYLEQKLFDTDVNKSLVRIINRYYKKYHKFPTAQTLVSSLPASPERNQILKICGFDMHDIDREAAVDLITTFFKQRRVRNVLTDAASAIYEGDFSNLSALVKDLEDSVKFNLFMDIGLNVVDDTETALNRLNEGLVAIPSAIDEIRAYTASQTGSGGWYRKSLSMFMGMPNVGKSILLCNEAAYAYQAGYNVLYVTLELAEELIWERLAVNITDIPLREIRGSKPEVVQELLKTRTKANAETCGNMFVKSLPTTTTVIEIDALLQEIQRTKGVAIDLLVVDYLGIMKPAKRENSYSERNLYTMGKEVAEQLRDLAKYYEIAVLTASQLNRDGYENTNSSMKNTAGSAGVNDTADFMVTITNDATLKQHKLFLHQILKNRFGPNSVAFLSHCDYSFMRVSSVTTEQYKAYSDAQVNQSITISEFNGDKDSIPEPQPKKAKSTGKGKKTEKKSQSSVNSSVESAKENILEVNATNENNQYQDDDDLF